LTPRAAALLAWSQRTRRDLPWRRTRDPWHILVSEAMLQQTQVARVVPRYHEFVERFPDIATCAAAPAAEVIERWAGLGYNRRAVNLHRAAAMFDERYGCVPDDLHALLAAPGIGPYTARAVLAFAFEGDVGVVDTNAARVLARWEGRRLGASEAQAVADAAVPPGQGWAWNQAVLDLGATVCTRRRQDCTSCPVTRHCCWSRSGRPQPDPALDTAGASGRQSRFEGSGRQGRGRLVAALRAVGAVAPNDLARVAGWPDEPDRAQLVATSLVADGLAAWRADGALTMPG
jgi:A/G-specific adenine glycosylase